MVLSVLLNKILLSVIISWLLGGVGKYIWNRFHKRKVSFLGELFVTGGMPSVHSATVTALSLSILFVEGFSPLFWVCVVFSALFIRDSFGVRWSVGEQAQLVNKLARSEHLEEKVKVVLGHTVTQVIGGIALGALVTAAVFIIL